MMECFTYSKTSNGTQGAREIIQCNEPEKQYCFMVYSITEENYDPVTNQIIDTNGIVATNGKCIGLNDKIDVGKGIGFMFNVKFLKGANCEVGLSQDGLIEGGLGFL